MLTAKKRDDLGFWFVKFEADQKIHFFYFSSPVKRESNIVVVCVLLSGFC